MVGRLPICPQLHWVSPSPLAPDAPITTVTPALPAVVLGEVLGSEGDIGGQLVVAEKVDREEHMQGSFHLDGEARWVTLAMGLRVWQQMRWMTY